MQIDAIDPQKTAIIVVDMQNDFVAAGAAMETPAARAVVPKLAEALNICRDARIKVIYTAHVHRRDGCDMGLFDDMHPPIANRVALIDGTPGVDIYAELAPGPEEHVIKKHRYSGFFGTDLDIILREWGVDTVIISGTTTENCCQATARDAPRGINSTRDVGERHECAHIATLMTPVVGPTSRWDRSGGS
jgi:nicotinamidase-related amidase